MPFDVTPQNLLLASLLLALIGVTLWRMVLSPVTAPEQQWRAEHRLEYMAETAAIFAVLFLALGLLTGAISVASYQQFLGHHSDGVGLAVLAAGNLYAVRQIWVGVTKREYPGRGKPPITLDGAPIRFGVILTTAVALLLICAWYGADMLASLGTQS